jgi:hypothetical protein
VAPLAGQPQALVTVGGHLHRESLGGEPACERGGDLAVVFDEEKLHGCPSRSVGDAG